MSKELTITADPKSPTTYIIKYTGGGQLPQELEGRTYTKQRYAQADIDAYLAQKAEKEAKVEKKGKKKNGATTAK